MFCLYCFTVAVNDQKDDEFYSYVNTFAVQKLNRQTSLTYRK